MITLRDKRLYPLVSQNDGPHVFGGQVTHLGATPEGSSVSVHKLFTLDLKDPHLPFLSSTVRYLPLYYPLKYGSGGASMQYEIVSEKEIRIIYLSDPEPDSSDDEYVHADVFPEVRYGALLPIQNREKLNWFTVTVGGESALGHLSNQCENSDCIHYHKAPDVDLIAAIPPGEDDIWWEFKGSYMYFYFWICRGCQTVLASNRST